jgi:formate-dependent nitrite reductase membrane component NrfD
VTARDGSITARGTEMRSYYERPILKEPVWKAPIPWYLFTGGVAGGCSVLHGAARATGNARLARSTLYAGAAMELVSPVLLAADLGRPERFLNMLRVFKVTSPMSVGSWILLASSGATNSAAALELTGRLPRLRRLAEAVSFAAGAPLATYTAALLANTATPAWAEAREQLPWLFAASAAASGGAAGTLVTAPAAAAPARRAAVAGVAVELGVFELMQRRLGLVGEVYRQGEAGRYARLSKVAAAAGAALLGLHGRRSRTAAVTGSALVLAGEAALRWSVFRAGFQSARDPRYVVEVQRARLQRRGDGARAGTDAGARASA